MFNSWRKLAQRVRTCTLCGRVVFAVADIVRQGHYIPRGSTGRISKVHLNGDYEVAFEGARSEVVRVHRREVAPAPQLARGGGALPKAKTLRG